MTDFRFTLDNPLYIRHILHESLKVVMHNPVLKTDSIKVVEGAAVLGKWYEDYKLAAPQIVSDIISKPKRVWTTTWCKPDNWSKYSSAI